MLLDDMLTLCQQAAGEAGDFARSRLGDVEPELKPGNELVTQVDRQCQAMIIEQIAKRWPEHGILAEEGPQGLLYKQPPAGQDDIWWVIDPIDGTRNYAHGLPQYAVSIGVIIDQMPVAGAIYDPHTQMMFSARQGAPAQCNGKQIQCRDETLNLNSQLGIPGNYPTGVPASIRQFLQNYGTMNLGSAALHLAYVAYGSYAATLSWKVKLWDIAAGAAICRSAGALVTDITGQERFPFDCAAYQGQPTPIIVASESVHQQVLRIMQTA